LRAPRRSRMFARQAHTRFLMLQEEDRREGGLPTFAKSG
jgi:hypothetical protein